MEPGYNKVRIDEEMMAIRRSILKEMVEMLATQSAQIYALQQQLKELQYGK